MSAPRATLPRSGARSWWALLVFVAAVAAAALIGNLAATGAGDQYAQLEQPAWAPPSWLFGPVWSVLYVLIAVSGWLVWRRVGVTSALIPYAVQLVLNAAWTPVFFGADRFGAAFAVIVALWLAIVVTIVVFLRVDRLAGLLLVPYLVWVTYAAALNWSIWQLNT